MSEENPINTLVVVTFPGVGARTFCKMQEQSDCQVLHLTPAKYGKTECMNIIKENLGKADIIVLPSSSEVRQALHENDIEFIAICPDNTPQIKEAYLERYKEGDYSDGFANLMDEEWDDLLHEIHSEESDDHIYCMADTDSFLSQSLYTLLSLHYCNLPLGLIKTPGYRFIPTAGCMLLVEIDAEQWCELLNRAIPPDCTSDSPLVTCSANTAIVDIHTLADIWRSWEGVKPHIMVPKGWVRVPKQQS